jgi:hypothetical protein
MGWGILLPAAITIVVVGAVIIVGWWLTGAVLRRLERSAWAFDRARRSLQRSSRRRTHLVVLGSLVLFVAPIQIYARLGGDIELLSLIVVIVCIAVVSVLHRIPGSFRSAKYTLTLGALGIWWSSLVVGLIRTQSSELGILRSYAKSIGEVCAGNLVADKYMALMQGTDNVLADATLVGRQPLWWDGLGYWALLVVPVSAVLVTLVVLMHLRDQARIRLAYRPLVAIGRYVLVATALCLGYADAAASRSAISADVHGAWLGSVAIFVMYAYCIARFHAIERMSETPILYLRSFSSAATKDLFGKVVAPVASRHGVLVGIAHEAQPSRELFGVSHPTDRGRFFACSDDDWRVWIETKLTQSSFVIADVTVETVGLTWELELARERLGDERILRVDASDCRNRAAIAAARRRIDAGLRSAERGAGWSIVVPLVALVIVIVALSLPHRGEPMDERWVRLQGQHKVLETEGVAGCARMMTLETYVVQRNRVTKSAEVFWSQLNDIVQMRPALKHGPAYLGSGSVMYQAVQHLGSLDTSPALNNCITRTQAVVDELRAVLAPLPALADELRTTNDRRRQYQLAGAGSERLARDAHIVYRALCKYRAVSKECQRAGSEIGIEILVPPLTGRRPSIGIGIDVGDAASCDSER